MTWRRGLFSTRLWWTGLFVLLLGLAACEEEAATPTPTAGVAAATTQPEESAATATAGSTAAPSLTPTASSTPLPSATPTPTRVPTGPVTVCMREEPASLYLYGPDSRAAEVVREVVYDGPVDTQGFEVQPVILEEIPSLENGGAVLETVPVREGEWVVDVEGNVVRLRPGLTVYPAGCTDTSCAVTYGPEQEEAEETPEAETEATPTATATPAVALEMDRLAVEFTLLPDLTWSDGEPLTAADSVFSFAIAQEASLPPRLRTGSQGVVPERTIDPVPRTASYTAVDERTVRWVGVPGFLDANYRSNFFIPLPEHQLGEYTIAELVEAEESARLPLGWGPYRLQEWVPGEQIVAERNSNYLRAGEGLPYFDQVIFRFLGSEPGDMVAALESGECDVVTRDLVQGDALAQYRTAADEGTVVLHAVPGTVWEHLDFGINPVPNYDWRGDYFQDARVRQAAAYCINREGLVDETTAGLSSVLNAYIHPAHPLYAVAELETYPYDPERGVELLAQAGWRDTNGDGVAEAYGVSGVGNGAILEFNYAGDDSALRGRIAEMVRADLAACGFRLYETEPVPAAEFYAADADSPVFGRRFDLANFAWFADAQPPCHLYLSSQVPTVLNGWVGFNVSGYENEAFDAACTGGQAAVPGMDAYRENHLEALRIFNRELPAIPLFLHAEAALTRPDLEGFSLDPTEPAETWQVEGWRLGDG